MADNSWVELHEAWCWTCPVCGKHNYADFVPLECSSDDIDELRREKAKLGENIFQLRMPERVKCKRRTCKEVFKVANILFGDDEDEEAEEIDDEY